MSELAVEALRKAGRLADENRALRSRLAEAEREHQDFRLQNDREWKAKVDHHKARAEAEADAVTRRRA